MGILSMNKWIKPLASWLSALMMLLTLALPVHAQEGARIDNISVKGNQRIESSTVLSYLTFAEGDAYQTSEINASLKRLFETGLFADVTTGFDAATLTVNVVENPVVNSITFEGNRRVEDDVLSAETALEPRSVYNRSKVQEDVRRIRNIYSRNGRFLVEVTPKVVTLEQNRVDLIFEINEGKKATIKRIYFTGNNNFDNDTLRQTIATQETRWYNFLTSNDSFDPDRVNYDKELLRQYYIERGYADFKVVSSVAEISDDKESFILTFVVEEGRKYSIGEVAIESAFADINKGEFYELTETKTDDTFNAKKVDKTVDNMTSRLNDLGYAFVDIETEYDRDLENNILNLTYRIKEGPKVYIERIDINGDVRTLDEVIRREFRISEGDPYNAAKIRRSRQRIQNLGFFKKVEIRNVKSNEPDRVNLDVEVEEQATGELNFGAGFSTSDGAIGSVSVRERNLLGKGQDLRLSFQKSSETDQIDVGFTEPYFMGRDIAAGFDLFNIRQSQDESSYDSETTGGTLRASYSLTEHLRHSLYYSLKNIDVSDVEPGASAFIVQQEGENSNSSIGHSLLYDHRNNRFTPTEGYYIRFLQEFAGVGGDSKYLKHELRSAYYIPVYGDDVVFSTSFQGGHVFGYADEDVRINERFFIGGSTIRGFDDAGIGPRDSSTRDALGGNTFYAGSTELTFPLGLPEELGFSGSVFADAGSLFGSDASGASVTDDRSLRLSAGVGISWKSPLGPIRVDIAEAILKDDLDETELVRFNFGTRF